MQIGVQNFSRKNIIFVAMALMTAGLFISNGTLSVATILFTSACLLTKDILKNAARAFKTPFLLAIMLLFFIPFISGLWSEDHSEWMDILRVKLPLLLFPLAFAGRWQLSIQQWKFIAILLLFLLAITTTISFVQYAINFSAVHSGYLRAKVMDTAFKNDHLRFSLLVSICILLCFWLIEHGYKAVRVVAAVIAFWLAIFLHILAVRTGLLCFYAILVVFFFRILFLKKTRFLLPLLGLMLLLPILAYSFLPTFQNRIKYLLYDHSFIDTGNYLPGSNDGNRVLSLNAGWNILKENPGGVGAGDIKAQANHWYFENVPGMLDSDKLYPSSEWLMHGAMAGWAGLILFTVIMLLPFFIRHIAHGFYWRTLHLVIILSLLFDTGLGMQIGVFLYSFFVLCFWKWARDRETLADRF